MPYTIHCHLPSPICRKADCIEDGISPQRREERQERPSRSSRLCGESDQTDANGNRTARFVDTDSSGTLNTGDTSITQYTWDHRNRLTSASSRSIYGGATTKVVEYYHDAFNNLVRRRLDADGAGTGGFTEKFWIYDGDEAILEFASGTATAPSHRYLWGPAVDRILADEQATAQLALQSTLRPGGRLHRSTRIVHGSREWTSPLYPHRHSNCKLDSAHLGGLS